MKNNLDAIDIAKFVMALLVVTIHIRLFSENIFISKLFTNGIGRIAVPFFFLCSGYFFMRKENFISFAHLLKTEKRIFTLFLGWTLVYMTLLFFTKHIYTDSPLQSLAASLFRHLILDPYAHLWYLPALMIGIFGTWFFHKFKLVTFGGVVALTLYFLGVSGDTYYQLIMDNEFSSKIMTTYSIVFKTMRNGIFFGFHMVFLATVSNRFSHRSNGLFALVGFVLLLTEYFIVKEYKTGRDYNMFFILPVFTYFFFYWIKDIHLRIQPSFSRFFREYSMGIYFIHVVYLILLPKIINNYFCVVLLTMITIWLIKKIKIPILVNLLK